VQPSSWARPCVEERYRCPRPRLRRSAPPNTRMHLRRRVGSREGCDCVAGRPRTNRAPRGWRLATPTAHARNR
jgi:hypothetical protein